MHSHFISIFSICTAKLLGWLERGVTVGLLKRIKITTQLHRCSCRYLEDRSPITQVCGLDGPSSWGAFSAAFILGFSLEGSVRWTRGSVFHTVPLNLLFYCPRICLLLGGAEATRTFVLSLTGFLTRACLLTLEIKALGSDTPEILCSPFPHSSQLLMTLGHLCPCLWRPSFLSSSTPCASPSTRPVLPSWTSLLQKSFEASCMSALCTVHELFKEQGDSTFRGSRCTCECVSIHIPAHSLMVQLSLQLFKQKIPLYQILPLFILPSSREEGFLNPFQIQIN